MDITKLFNWAYLIERYPEGGFSWKIRVILYGLFGLAILAAILFGLQKKNVTTAWKKLLSKIQVWGWSFGLVGLLLAYFREVRALFLGSRIYMLLWLVIGFVWLIFIIKYWKRDIPKKQETIKSEAEYNKWLPKSK